MPVKAMADAEADLLKVAPLAGLDEIKKAYRKAALVHHPDQNPHPEAARHFRRLTEAYRILSEQALKREPVRTKRAVSPTDRVEFLLLDIRSFLKRWPEERWATVVDGLPTGVWMAGVLEVMARAWPGSPPSSPVEPNPSGIADAVEKWVERLSRFPLPSPLPRASLRALQTALDAAEIRLKALEPAPSKKNGRRPQRKGL